MYLCTSMDLMDLLGNKLVGRIGIEPITNGLRVIQSKS